MRKVESPGRTRFPIHVPLLVAAHRPLTTCVAMPDVFCVLSPPRRLPRERDQPAPRDASLSISFVLPTICDRTVSAPRGADRTSPGGVPRAGLTATGASRRFGGRTMFPG